MGWKSITRFGTFGSQTVVDYTWVVFIKFSGRGKPPCLPKTGSHRGLAPTLTYYFYDQIS
jgi:hypothetical protein